MEDDKKLAPINVWKCTSIADKVCESDGKLFVVRFDRIFGEKKLAVYNRFSIKKTSHEKLLDPIAQYINFFIKYYDKENELGMAYLSAKVALDKDKLFGFENMQALIDFIYEKMFTPTMVAKINQMVDDNYKDDIETEKGARYSAKNKKYLESLEFTNEHIRLMLAISFSMKLISPVMYHYFSINVIKIDKTTYYIYEFYRRLFDIFGTTCNMYNKLFVYTKTKVLESKANNELIFGQREILGFDEFSLIHKFVRKHIIEENMVKFKLIFQSLIANCLRMFLRKILLG